MKLQELNALLKKYLQPKKPGDSEGAFFSISDSEGAEIIRAMVGLNYQEFLEFVTQKDIIGNSFDVYISNFYTQINNNDGDKSKFLSKTEIENILFKIVKPIENFIDLAQQKKLSAVIMAGAEEVVKLVNRVTFLKSISRANAEVFSELLSFKNIRDRIKDLTDLEYILRDEIANPNTNTVSQIKDSKMEEGVQTNYVEKINEETLKAIDEWFSSENKEITRFVHDYNDLLGLVKIDAGLANHAVENNDFVIGFIDSPEKIKQIFQVNDEFAAHIIELIREKEKNIKNTFITNFDELADTLNYGLAAFRKLIEIEFVDKKEENENKEDDEVDEMEEDVDASWDVVQYINNFEKLLIIAKKIQSKYDSIPETDPQKEDFKHLYKITCKVLSKRKKIRDIITKPEEFLKICASCAELANYLARTKAINKLSFDEDSLAVVLSYNIDAGKILYAKQAKKRKRTTDLDDNLNSSEEEQSSTSESDSGSELSSTSDEESETEFKFADLENYSHSFKLSIATLFLKCMGCVTSNRAKLLEFADVILKKIKEGGELSEAVVDMLIGFVEDTKKIVQAHEIEQVKKRKTTFAEENVSKTKNKVVINIPVSATNDRDKVKNLFEEVFNLLFKKRSITHFSSATENAPIPTRIAAFLIKAYQEMKPKQLNEDDQNYMKDIDVNSFSWVKNINKCLKYVYDMDKITIRREYYLTRFSPGGAMDSMQARQFNRISRVQAAHILATLELKGYLTAKEIETEIMPKYKTLSVNANFIEQEDHFEKISKEVLKKCNQPETLGDWMEDKFSENFKLCIPTLVLSGKESQRTISMEF